MLLRSVLFAALAFAGTVHAQIPNPTKFEVSQRQLDRLLEIVQRMEGKNRRIANDFGTAEVMPRERDRRDFRREMSDLDSDSTRMILNWIERVKSNDTSTPPVTPPMLPPPPDMTLTEAFVENTGYSFYDASSFNSATQRAQKLCEAWRAHVTANNAGQIIFGQCSGGEQVKTEDGKIGARVTGSMKITFAALAGVEAPKEERHAFSENTGYSFFDESSYQSAVKVTLGQCAKWNAQLKSLSKGILIVQYCTAPKIFKGFDGKLWVSTSGATYYTTRPLKTQPTVLTQSFVNSTGYSFYDASSVKTAGGQSEAQCTAWVNDTLKSSTAMPLLVSCNGPEVVQGSKIDVRFTGKIVLVVP